jgi:hypothetical protein
VCIVTGYGLDCRDSIPGRGSDFYLSTESRLALGPSQPPNQCVQGTLSPGAKRMVREAHDSPPSTTEAPTYVHGVVLVKLSTGTNLPLQFKQVPMKLISIIFI